MKWEGEREIEQGESRGKGTVSCKPVSRPQKRAALPEAGGGESAPGISRNSCHRAMQIGDDTLAWCSPGKVIPETFPHGRRAQRQAGYRCGLERGSPGRCDTFSARNS